MTTVNFLPERNQIVNLETGDWTITNGTMSVANLVSPVSLFHSFYITPTASNSIVELELASIIIPSNYRFTPIQFHARVKSTTGLKATVLMDCSETELSGYVSTRDTKVNSNTWKTIRSNLMIVPDISGLIYGRVKISFVNHGGLPFYFSVPFMYSSYSVLEEQLTISTYAQLPSIFLIAENNQLNQGYLPEFPTLRLIEAGSLTSEDCLSTYYDFEYVDEEDAGQLTYTPTPSTLVEPDNITDANAKWLSQILGFTLDDPQQLTTPWGGLPSSWGELTTAVDATGLSANASSLVRSSSIVTATFASATGLSIGDSVSVTAVDGTATTFSGTFTVTGVTTTPSHTATWAQTGSNETATETHKVALLDTSWSELEEFNPDYFEKATYSSWQIENGYSGLHAGTLTALKESAKFNLIGGKVVTVTKNYSSNPWRILITTKTSETPGGVTDSENETILRAIQQVKPLGFKVSHVCTVSGA
jgi:hypothetical protein